MNHQLLKGKRGLIMGVANEFSIAWGIAKAFAENGAGLAFTYQNDLLLRRVKPLAESIGSDYIIGCDVANDADIDQTFENIRQKWGELDFVVHAIAFSDKNELKGKYCHTSRGNFNTALDISCYSFTAVCQRAYPLMKKGGSFLTMSYYGAEKVMPHYNVMGVAKAALEASVKYIAADLGEYQIRVNSISAGPMRTLAAKGIGDFNYILQWNQRNAPLRRNTTMDDIAGSALYLASDLSAGVTGENLHVDGGYHVVGMKAIEAEDIPLVR